MKLKYRGNLMTQEQIEQALTLATDNQITEALQKRGYRCISWYDTEYLMNVVEGVTEEQALAWLEDAEDGLQEQWGEVFLDYVNRWGDEALTINTEGAQ
jgi:hypothetical protein